MAKKFKPNKSSNMTLQGPTGHRYTFASDIEVKAIYNEVWHEEDENWMVWCCTIVGGEKLIEVDAPRDIPVREVTKLTQHDILGSDPDVEAHPVIVNQEKQNEEALIALAGVEARNAAREAAGEFDKKVFDVIDETLAGSEKKDDLVVKPSKNVEEFLATVKKNKTLSGEDLLNKLKISFSKGQLVALCKELNLGVEGVRKELVSQLLDNLLE